MLSSYTIEKGTLSGLPLLLAGPILRRVEPNQVCIWIACSKNVSVQAEIFRVRVNSLEKIDKTHNDNDDQSSIVDPIGYGSTKSIRLGENLFIALVVARPLQPNIEYNNNSPHDKMTFPTDELLAYDVEITYDVDSHSDPNH